MSVIQVDVNIQFTLQCQRFRLKGTSTLIYSISDSG